MLVLSRKQGEAINIGDDITIVLVRTGVQTRIGIVAPRNVPVVREELADDRPYDEWSQREKEAAAEGAYCRLPRRNAPAAPSGPQDRLWSNKPADPNCPHCRGDGVVCLAREEDDGSFGTATAAPCTCRQ